MIPSNCLSKLWCEEAGISSRIYWCQTPTFWTERWHDTGSTGVEPLVDDDDDDDNEGENDDDEDNDEGEDDDDNK